MSNIINVLYILVAVIGAIYVAPFLIALIASAVIKLLIAILFLSTCCLKSLTAQIYAI
jgi:hypothetical protein